ncbi:MAG: hypothetical protein WC878_05410 [Candidatus Paceibacterota bacterium]|jgi:hypothetical protein
MKMLKNKKILFAIGILLALSSFAVWATSASVSWTPARYAPYSVEPGQATTTTVTFTNNGPSAINGKKLSLEVRGDAASAVSVTQPNFPTTIKKGESVSVNLSVQTSSDMPMGVIDGTLALLETKPNGTTKDVFKSVLPIEITVSPFLLPPATPADEEEATIAGVDLDENGVPDRVDRWIGFSYPQSEKRMMALTEMAKTEQKFMMDHVADPSNELKAQENSLLSSKNQNCQWYVFGATVPGSQSDEAMWAVIKDTKTLLALITNTKERYNAYFSAENYLGGMIYSGDRRNYKSDCSFDPESLPN